MRVSEWRRGILATRLTHTAIGLALGPYAAWRCDRPFRSSARPSGLHVRLEEEVGT